MAETFTKYIKKRQTPESFRQEVQILASLDHPNIVTVLDYDLEAEKPYMITEYIEGGTLQDADLSEWSLEEKQKIYWQICRAVGYVHSQGYIKNDIASGNIMLREDKTPVLIDFEHSKPLDEANGWTAGDISFLGRFFWELIHGEDFHMVQYRSQEIDKKIAVLTEQIEQLQAEKAELGG